MSMLTAHLVHDVLMAFLLASFQSLAYLPRQSIHYLSE